MCVCLCRNKERTESLASYDHMDEIEHADISISYQTRITNETDNITCWNTKDMDNSKVMQEQRGILRD